MQLRKKLMKLADSFKGEILKRLCFPTQCYKEILLDMVDICVCVCYGGKTPMAKMNFTS